MPPLVASGGKGAGENQAAKGWSGPESLSVKPGGVIPARLFYALSVVTLQLALDQFSPHGHIRATGDPMKKFALIVLASAGSTTIEFQESYPNSFAKQHVEAVLPLAAEKALTTPGLMLTRLKADESRSVGAWGTGDFTEGNFRYVYRLDEDGNSWLLPAEEYPR
jgi:hypothetical protein